MSIRMRIMLFLSILFITVFANSYLFYQFERYTQEKATWVSFTHEVIILTQHLLEEMNNQQRGERGYLLTQDRAYLEPYYEGTQHLNQLYKRLYNMTLHNDEQTQRLEQVKTLMDKNSILYQKIISLALNGNFPQAIEIVKQNSGKKNMDAIIDILNTYTEKENRLLAERKGEFLEHRSQIMTLTVGSILFFLIIAILTYIFLERTLFAPMKILLQSTHKMQNSEEIDIQDILAQDEMGFLLASFYKMHQEVFKREQMLHYTATHDSLTGLSNRLEVNDYILKAIEKAQKMQTNLAILFIDVNKFKTINDTLGHEIGDVVLQEIAVRLQSSVRSSDNLFRIGGDEFLIVVQLENDTEVINIILEKILTQMQSPITSKEKSLEVSLSIGISLFPKDAKTPQELIKNADIAMYVAKQDKEIAYKFFETSMLKRASD